MAQTMTNESIQQTQSLLEQQVISPDEQQQTQQIVPNQDTEQHQDKLPITPETIDFIEVIKALHQGKMPNNNQIREMLNRLLNIRAIDERQHLMSSDGQKLLADCRSLIVTLQKMLYCKNGDQLLQSLHYHLHNLNLQPIKEQSERFHNMNGEQHPTGEQVKKEVKRGARALLKIGKLIITNGHFREQLSELTAISEEVFSDTASELANISNQLNDLIQDDLSQQEMIGQKVQQQQLNAKSNNNGSRCTSIRAQYDATPDPTTEFAASEELQLKSDEDNSGEDEDDMQTQLDSEKEEWRQLLYEQTERFKKAKQYAREKFSAEKVGELVDRLKTVIAEVQANPGYQDAINTLIWLFELGGHRTENAGGMVSQTAQEYRSDPNWVAAEAEIRTIIEDWAQGRSLDPLIRGVDTIIEDIMNNDDLHQCYVKSTQYMCRLLQEPGYVTHDQSTEDGKYLVNRIRELTTGRYRDHVDFLINETKAYLNTMEEDPMARELEMRFKQIHNDLWLDPNGNTTFKPQLLTDLRMILPPTLLELIKFLPIPRIEYSDRQVDLALENIILPGDTLLPGNLEIKMDNKIRFSPHTNITGVNHQSILIKVTDIRTTIKDVVWFYKRKVGFPKLSDRGTATVAIGGKKGVSATIKIISDSKNKVHTFSIAKCKCHVDKVKIKIKGSRHDMLYRTIKPLMVSILKRHIEKNIESKIIELIDQADSKITNSVTKQYKDAMAKETSTQTIVTPSNYQQTVTTTSTPVVITTTAATDETHVVPIESQERPGLFVALLTIMNRSIRSLMISGMQDQQAKQRKKKMEKMSTQEQLVYSKEDPMQDVKRQQLVPAANTSNTVTDSSSKMSIEGNSPIKSTNKMMMGSTPSGNTIPNDNTNMDSNLHIDKNMVSVIVGSNGHTYMEKNSKLVPVHIVGGLGADHIQMNGQYGIVQTNHVMKNSSFSSNKDNQDLNTSSSQDINNFQQQYHHSITEANTERT